MTRSVTSARPTKWSEWNYELGEYKWIHEETSLITNNRDEMKSPRNFTNIPHNQLVGISTNNQLDMDLLGMVHPHRTHPCRHRQGFMG